MPLILRSPAGVHTPKCCPKMMLAFDEMRVIKFYSRGQVWWEAQDTNRHFKHVTECPWCFQPLKVYETGRCHHLKSGPRGIH